VKPVAPISVIIPALSANPSLLALAEHLSDCDIFEILVISPQKPLAIKIPKVCCLSAKVGRGQQIQAGLDAAKGDIIWILHSDSCLPPHAVESLRQTLAAPNTSLGCFRLGFENPGFWLRFFSWMSRFDTLFSTFGDQGFFFKRSIAARLPRLTTYPLMEDVVIRRHLLKYGRVQKSPLMIKTSSERFKHYGPLRTQFKNAGIFWKFWMGTSPAELHAHYYALPSKEMRPQEMRGVPRFPVFVNKP